MSHKKELLWSLWVEFWDGSRLYGPRLCGTLFRVLGVWGFGVLGLWGLGVSGFGAGLEV